MAAFKVELPDSDEIEWIAKQYVRMFGGKLKFARVLVVAESEIAQHCDESRVREDLSRIRQSIQDHRKLPIAADDPLGNWWEEELNRFKHMEWLSQFRLDILTKTADERAGRAEELAWVQSVNDLAREIDRKIKEQAGWVHPSVILNSEEVRSKTLEFIEAAKAPVQLKLF